MSQRERARTLVMWLRSLGADYSDIVPVLAGEELIYTKAEVIELEDEALGRM